MKTYSVRIIKKAGIDPITQKPTPQAEETLTINDTTPEGAAKQGKYRNSLRFMGQEMEVYVDGQLVQGNF